MTQFSAFGEKFTRPSGITQLMKDLGDANHSSDKTICMLGGGNPASIPAAEEIFQAEMQALLNNDEQFNQVLGLYDGPKGSERFTSALIKMLNERYNWNLTTDNVCLTNGSQNSFFSIFNLLAGKMADGSHKKILFPLAPEYVGYAEIGLSENMFTSNKPEIELLEEQQFKYHIDFDALNIGDDIAAICISRPTNPTGNVVTDQEMAQLELLAKKHKIPLIVDNAYGFPFPGAIYTDVNPNWDDNIILTMSLSKLGLPGMRTGIVIANPEIIAAMSSINAITALAPNSVGPGLMTRLLEKNEIMDLRENIIRPFYREKAQTATQIAQEKFKDLPVRIHKAEGAFFLWLWCEGLPVSSVELYERLVKRGVFIIPGEHFFIDIENDWQHQRECIRMTYAQPDHVVERGLSIIAEEITLLFDANGC
ncbi:MAG: valine--pyruvate transaminase [Arenicella sp.]